MTNILLKTPEEITIMAEGGKKLGKIKHALMEKVRQGVNAKEIDDLADELIKKTGGKASFKMVSGYHWATCVNVNVGVVHGIPKKEVIFKNGDLVSIDIGLFYKGFHTDTSISFEVGGKGVHKLFLETGKKALLAAIGKTRVGHRISDISRVGRDLHEEPPIPCFINGKTLSSPEIPKGAVLAIEVMYSTGSGEIKVGEDGWTISTSDDTISGLFEDSVAVTKNGPLVLTESSQTEPDSVFTQG